MNIATAFAEIRLANKKIEAKRDFIMRNLFLDDRLKDPFIKDGTTQQAEVDSALQSISDLKEYILRLNTAIARTNANNSLKVEGVERTVAEWLTWRNRILPVEREMVMNIASMLERTTRDNRDYGRSVQTPPPNLTYMIGEAWVSKERDRLDTIDESLDGMLSVFNAVTEIQL